MKKRISPATIGWVCAVLVAMGTLCPETYAADKPKPKQPERIKPAAAMPQSAQKQKPSPKENLATEKPKPTPRANPATLTPEMRFEEAIDVLRNSTQPPLNIIVYWKEIGDNAGIYRDTPIGLDGAAGLRVGQYLRLLLLSVSATASAPLGYTVDKGVVVIATQDALPSRKVTRVYDVSDLVAEPAQYRNPMMGMGGLFGRSMMGSYGGGLGAGYGQTPFSSYSSGRGREVSGLVNGRYGNARRRSGPNRRR